MATVEITGLDEIQQRLSQINSPIKRRSALKKIANLIKKDWSKRLTDQVEITGAAFKPRSAKTPQKLKKKKMHRGLKKRVGIIFVDENKAVIGFKGKDKGIASIQMFGFTRTAQKRTNNPTRNLPATVDQAQNLRALGYKIPGTNKTPTLTWIKTNMTQGSAGIVIRELRGEQPKQSWQIVIQARNAGGVNYQELQQIRQIIASALNGN